MILFISGAEIIFVFLVVLLVFGAKKVPDIAKTLGKSVRNVNQCLIPSIFPTHKFEGCF